LVETRKRVRLREPVQTIFKSGGSNGRGIVYDVSLGGLFVQSPLLLRPGAKIAASLTPPAGEAFAFRGTVVWNTATVSTPLRVSGFGVRVTEMTPEFVRFVGAALAAATQAP
jgi:hypothetical protein